MPEISRFFGIVVRMHVGDHPWPHFHARSEAHTISIRIADGEVIGHFPPRKLTLVQRWWRLHREELSLNWWLLEHDLPPRYIEPLD